MKNEIEQLIKNSFRPGKLVFYVISDRRKMGISQGVVKGYRLMVSETHANKEAEIIYDVLLKGEQHTIPIKHDQLFGELLEAVHSVFTKSLEYLNVDARAESFIKHVLDKIKKLEL